MLERADEVGLQGAEAAVLLLGERGEQGERAGLGGQEDVLDGAGGRRVDVHGVLVGGGGGRVVGGGRGDGGGQGGGEEGHGGGEVPCVEGRFVEEPLAGQGFGVCSSVRDRLGFEEDWEVDLRSGSYWRTCRLQSPSATMR